MPGFDPDQRIGDGDDLAILGSAEWWNGLLEHVRRGARLQADPATGLQVVPGTNNNTIALAGSRRRCWARAGSNIGAATGTGGAQMTGGTVRLWFTDAAGLRTDSGIDVTAYNGSTTAVTAGRWLKVELEDSVWQVYYEDCP